MVQVVRGGTIYFVPESEALATDELVGPEAYGPQEEGFVWAEGSAALAAPQRRTMHRYVRARVAWLLLRTCCCRRRFLWLLCMRFGSCGLFVALVSTAVVRRASILAAVVCTEPHRLVACLREGGGVGTVG